MRDDINTLLRRQHGVITRSQARAVGLSDRQITRRMAEGDLVAVHRGVLRHVAFPTSYAQRVRGVLLALGPEAAASHRSAAGLIGVRGLDVGLVEVSWPHRSPRPLSAVVVHRAPDLHRRWIRRIDGLAVTRAERTLIDLGAVVHPWLLQRCLEEWLVARKVTIARVEQAIAAHGRRGRPGVAVVRRALEQRVLRDVVADSRFEAMLGEVLLGHGLPRPTHHHVVRDGRTVAELDWAYPVAMVALEFDGYGVHLRSLEAFEHDRERQNELEILGWHVLRFTERQVRDRPQYVAGQVGRMLGVRMPRFGGRGG
ncbi:MAG TPA: type IV toxin-antitoxin system AbiEi family antitoxin domain-containing protein [Acidimicrobiales bacterium]|nr:type IV toxin-antitoxin system AbiEi family antitoxin domain-containing protein [Acidimicrobiales bacterium]